MPSTLARLEHDERVAGVEGVGGAAHRLDGDADLALAVLGHGGEDLEPREGRVGPERRRAVGGGHRGAPHAVGVAQEVGVGRVEAGAADGVALAEVVGLAETGRFAAGSSRSSTSTTCGRDAQLDVGQQGVADGEVGVRAVAERRGRRTDVAGRRVTTRPASSSR